MHIIIYEKKDQIRIKTKNLCENIFKRPFKIF